MHRNHVEKVRKQRKTCASTEKYSKMRKSEDNTSKIVNIFLNVHGVVRKTFPSVENTWSSYAHAEITAHAHKILGACAQTQKNMRMCTIIFQNVQKRRTHVLTLSVKKSASATDRRFPATLLHACVILSKSTHPFRPAHARCGDLSFCRFTDLRTASVPAFQPPQTFMTCLTQSGPCGFFFFFLSIILKG